MVTRNPLDVPVAEASIEELDAQAHHHALTAAVSNLEEFLEDTRHVPEMGMLVEATRTSEGFDTTITEPTRLIWLRDRTDSWLIFFRGEVSGTSGYGIRNDESKLIQMHSIPELRMKFGDQFIMNMSAKLNELKVIVGLRLSVQPSS